MKRSRRELSIDVAEHLTQAYLEKLLNNVHLPFWFYTLNRYDIPQTGGFVLTVRGHVFPPHLIAITAEIS